RSARTDELYGGNAAAFGDGRGTDSCAERGRRFAAGGSCFATERGRPGVCAEADPAGRWRTGQRTDGAHSRRIRAGDATGAERFAVRRVAAAISSLRGESQGEVFRLPGRCGRFASAADRRGVAGVRGGTDHAAAEWETFRVCTEHRARR